MLNITINKDQTLYTDKNFWCYAEYTVTDNVVSSPAGETPHGALWFYNWAMTTTQIVCWYGKTAKTEFSLFDEFSDLFF